MNRSSLFCKGWGWLFLLLPIALLILLLIFKWDVIENDVANSANSRLKEAGIEWPEVTTFHRGRDVLLTGTAPSLNAIEEARSLVLQAKGVRAVDVDAADLAPVPASLSAIVTGQTIVLRGSLKDQASIDSVLARAAQTFGEGNILNKLSIDNNVTRLPAMDGLFPALAIDGKIGTITASLSDNVITLSGAVLNEQAKTQMTNSLLRGLSGDVDNQLMVIAQTTPVEIDVCVDLVEQLLSTAKINFESGNASIKEGSIALLENISKTARRCPEAKFEVAGHTDATGNPNLNMSLSERRATAVVEYLVEQGLNAEHFVAVGFGATQPVASNSNSEGRAANRRIEFRLKN